MCPRSSHLYSKSKIGLKPIIHENNTIQLKINIRYQIKISRTVPIELTVIISKLHGLIPTSDWVMNFKISQQKRMHSTWQWHTVWWFWAPSPLGRRWSAKVGRLWRWRNRGWLASQIVTMTARNFSQWYPSIFQRCNQWESYIILKTMISLYTIQIFIQFK